jgi:hypothetical protein
MVDLNIHSIYRGLLLETVNRSAIIDAINNHDEVVIYYTSNDPKDAILNGYRTIQPFVYGVRKQSGNPVIRAWLVGGASKSKDNPKDELAGRPGWRTFRVDRIMSMSKTFKKFDTSNERLSSIKYNPNDKDMSTIYASVTPESVTQQQTDEKPGKKLGGMGHSVVNTFSNIKNKFKSLFKE